MTSKVCFGQMGNRNLLGTSVTVMNLERECNPTKRGNTKQREKGNSGKASRVSRVFVVLIGFARRPGVRYDGEEDG